MTPQALAVSTNLISSGLPLSKNTPTEKGNETPSEREVCDEAKLGEGNIYSKTNFLSPLCSVSLSPVLRILVFEQEGSPLFPE